VRVELLSDRRKPQPTWLIDDNGCMADSQSPALRRDLNAWHIGDGFTDYAVRNLGFVAVQLHGAPGALAVHVRLRPSHVSPVAFSGLMYWLSDKQPRRVMLSRLDDGAWHSEVLGDCMMATPKLATLVKRAQCGRKDDFLAKQTAIENFAPEHPLRALLSARGDLAEAVARLDLDAVRAIAGPLVQGRFTLSTADQALRRVVVRSVGNGYSAETNYWLNRIIGHRLTDLPDSDYGGWASDAYAQAMSTGIPQADAIDIFVEWPFEGRRRYRNHRLLLPLPLADGQGYAMLGATVPAPGLDLRLQRGEPTAQVG
jgi:hypothetical protein